MKNKNTPRLLGIDLMRGIAAYAVVFLHSGDESSGLPISQATMSLRLLFYFAVPFFLATAFYFLTSKPEIDISWRFWHSRIDRILIPYILWSIFYLISRSFFFFQSHQMDSFWNLWGDPLSLVFFGGASYQLYFLPLLFVGTFSVAIAKYLQKIRANRLAIGLLAILSLIIYECLLQSGNTFRLNPNTAFQNIIHTAGWDIQSLPLLRLLLVQIAWLLSCLPYLFMGMLLLPLCHRINKWNQTARLITIFLCASMFLGSAAAIFIGIPDTVKNVLQAYSLLVLSIALSGYIKNNWLVQSVGDCSFGIYLIHPFAMLVVKGVFNKTLPILSQEVSILSIAIVSIGTFIISWSAIGLMKKNYWISKYALGI